MERELLENLSRFRWGRNRAWSDSGKRWVNSGVKGTLDTPSTLVKDVRVNHGRANVLVPEQFLDGPDVVPGFEEMSRETMTKRMAASRLFDFGRSDSFSDGAL